MELTQKFHPKSQVWIKFILLLALLASYVVYLTYEYDLLTGGVAALLSWSFFVLCTPIADAGFLLDFPLRLLFGFRMVYSEILVWTIAISLNIAVLAYGSHYYQTTALTEILHQILTQPFPYWGVILLSALGTFLSIQFGDELMDVVHHHQRDFFHSHHFKHELIIGVFLLVVIYSYFRLIESLGIEQLIESF